MPVSTELSFNQVVSLGITSAIAWTGAGRVSLAGRGSKEIFFASSIFWASRGGTGGELNEEWANGGAYKGPEDLARPYGG